MKRTAYLINIGRGAIVDLADLVAALEAGEIAGAALDVFEIEPLPADHPLWEMRERDPHAARGRLLAADRRAAPGRAAGERRPVRRAASRSSTSSTRRCGSSPVDLEGSGGKSISFRELRDRLSALGAEPVGSTPDQCG